MKAKKFSRKLLALFLAVLMAMSCFSGAMVASAANASANTKYHDQDLDFNSLGWPILNDEQACTALLDFVDLTLAQANIAPMNIDLSVLGSITIKLGSVDEVLKTVQDLDSFLNSKSALLLLAGDARYVDLSAVNGMSRSATSSTDIVRGIVKLVRNISSDGGPEGANGNIVKKLLRGDLGLGIVSSFLDVYKTIGDLIGMPSGYQSNMVYNIVQQLVLENTGWFTAEEKAQIRNNPSLETSKLDSILLDKLGFEWGKSLVHFSYGMVELPEGKMKSREGTVVDADDLMEEMISTAKETSNELGKLDGLSQEEADNIARIVGLGALKYFILKVDARKNMTFNPKESIDFNGNTGPFIQYTYARIQSVMRKAAEAGIVIPAEIPVGIELSEKEEGLIQMVADFAAVVKQAGADYSPSIIANYTYDLVKEYNQFYHDFSILREENEAVKVFRLALSENVAKVVRISMGLLGIEVPDRM